MKASAAEGTGEEGTTPPADAAADVAADVAVAVPSAATGGPVSHAIFRVARTHRMIAGQLLRRVGLHPGQELVMMQLWELGPQRQADLVRLLDSDAATMARTVRRLEQAGFVRRCPCADDKRAYLIEATTASHALREQVESLWRQLEDATLANLSPTERAEVLHVLEGLESRLTQAAAQLGA